MLVSEGFQSGLRGVRNCVVSEGFQSGLKPRGFRGVSEWSETVWFQSGSEWSETVWSETVWCQKGFRGLKLCGFRGVLEWSETMKSHWIILDEDF